MFKSTALALAAGLCVKNTSARQVPLRFPGIKTCNDMMLYKRPAAWPTVNRLKKVVAHDTVERVKKDTALQQSFVKNTSVFMTTLRKHNEALKTRFRLI